MKKDPRFVPQSGKGKKKKKRDIETVLFNGVLPSVVQMNVIILSVGSQLGKT
jgi:hypothetical protein